MSELAALIAILTILATIFVSMLGGVYVILSRIGALEQVVSDGLKERLAHVEKWVAWLVRYRVDQSDRTGVAVPTPIPDTDEIDEVLP